MKMIPPSCVPLYHPRRRNLKTINFESSIPAAILSYQRILACEHDGRPRLVHDVWGMLAVVIARGETIVGFNRPRAILLIRRSHFASLAVEVGLRSSGKGREMDVHVRLGPGLLQRAGTPRLTLTLPEGATIRDALASLREMHPDLLLSFDTMLTVVDGTTVNDLHILCSGAELALLFPVSGGSRRNNEEGSP